MDGTAMDELLAFLACPTEAGDDDQWLVPMSVDASEDAMQTTRLAYDLTSTGGSDSLRISLTSPRFELMDERSFRHFKTISGDHLDLSDSNSGDSSPAQKPPKRRSRKQEIAGLKDQVALLSLELNTLKEKAGIDINAPVARVPATKTREIVAKTTQGLLLWERIASKQRERRQISEEENRVLREAMIAHIRRAKRLRQMLSKRAKEESNALVPAISRSKTNTSLVLIQPDNEEALEQFRSEVEAIYVTIDDEFRRAGMQQLPRPGQSSSHSICDSKRWSLEIKEIRIVPFDYKHVSRMVWRNYGGSSDDESEKEVCRSYRFSYIHPAGPTLRITSTNLVRRYVEPEREVIVIRSFIRPAPGITVNHTNRIVIWPGKSSMGSSTAEIEMYATAEGETANGLHNTLSRMFPGGWEKDLGAGLWANALSRSIDEIESELLNESVTTGYSS